MPSLTSVSVPSQRSDVSHSVPRTVAEANLPWVRKLPLPCPQRLRTTVLLAMIFFLAVGLALGLAFGGFAPTAETARFAPPQRVGKSPPFSCRSGVWSVAWSIVNTAPKKIADCTSPAGVRALIDRKSVV